MEQHYVCFMSPGTFVAEETREPVDSWDVSGATERARSIQERHGSRPYGFYFYTKARTDEELDSRVVASSPMHYFKDAKAVIQTLDDIPDTPENRILRSNMRSNGYDRVITTFTPWRNTRPLEADDVLVEVD